MTITIEKTLPETFEVGQKVIVTDTIGAYEAVLGSLVTVRRTGLGFSGLLVEVEDADGVTYQMYDTRFRSLRQGDRVLVEYQTFSQSARDLWNGPATINDVRHDYFVAPVSVVTDSGQRGAFGYDSIKALPEVETEEEALAEWEKELLGIEEPLPARPFHVGDTVTGYGNWTGTIEEIYGETVWGHGDCLVHWHGSRHGKTLGATLDKLTLVEAVEDQKVAPVIEADVIATIEDIDAFRAVNVEGAILRSPRTGKVYGKFGNMWQTVGTEESAGWSILRLVEDGVPFQVLYLP